MLENYVDVPGLRRAYQGLRAGNTENALLIWKVLILGLWLRRESTEKGVEANACAKASWIPDQRYIEKG